MLGTQVIRKSTTLFLAMAFLCVCSAMAFAAPRDVTGEIIVNGQVSVDGQPAISNSTVVSGSTITTGANSSALINLGKNGRVEILDDSSLTLRFTDNSIVGSLTAGKIRVTNNAGIGTTFTTTNATIIADAGQTNSFSVDAGCGDTAQCSQTFVETVNGMVTLRNGTIDKQVAAGTDATVGNPSQQGCKPCLRPNPNPGVFPVAGIGSGALAALLLAIAGGVAAAIFLARRNNGFDNGTIGGPINVVSPVR